LAAEVLWGRRRLVGWWGWVVLSSRESLRSRLRKCRGRGRGGRPL
jgi:hypothetical protein